MDLELGKETEYEVLEAKYRALEYEKLGIEKQLEDSKRENAELKEGIRGFGEEKKRDFGGPEKAEREFVVTDDDPDEDLVTRLMIENKLLECEKEKAERDVSALQSKIEALELKLRAVLEPGLDGEQFSSTENSMVNKEKVGDFVNTGDEIGSPKDLGLPTNFTPCKLGERHTNSQRVRRELSFEEVKNPSVKKIIVDISDSDEEPNITSHAKFTTQNKGSVATDSFEDIDAWDKNFPRVSTLKRKRAANIVVSDSESNDDDDIPIGRLMNVTGNRSSEAPKRRLAPLRNCRAKGAEQKKSPPNTTETQYGRGIPMDVNTENDDSNEIDSESEGESLGGFIVDDPDVCVGEDVSSESEDTEEGELDFSKVLSDIQRKKKRNNEWIYEAEMLTDLANDDELCMKGVCAIYRRQTSDEMKSKGTYHKNSRGFSTYDALKGTKLAEFLTNGDPRGEVKKSIEQLKKHDPNAVNLCRELVKKYSRQLFEIYKEKEDPDFRP